MLSELRQSGELDLRVYMLMASENSMRPLIRAADRPAMSGSASAI